MIGKRICALLESRNRNASDLARHCGVSPQAAHQWIRGHAQPRGKKLELIAEFFGLTQQELEYAPVLSLTPVATSLYYADAIPSESASRQAADLMISAETSICPRSIEYTQGMRDKIVSLLCGITTTSSFKIGTCQADAYEAGQLRAEHLIASIQTQPD